MAIFDDREKTYERKYALDEETAFKVMARRNKLVGLWAAEELGKSGADAEAYAKEVVMADFERAGDGDVVEKLLGDLQAAGLAATEADIRREMERCLHEARKQITGKKE